MECFTIMLIWCVIQLGRQVPGTKSNPHSLLALTCCHSKEFIALSTQVSLCNCEDFIIWLTAGVKCLVYFKSTIRVLEALKLQVHLRLCFCLIQRLFKMPRRIMMLDSYISDSQTKVCVTLVVRELCGMQEPRWKDLTSALQVLLNVETVRFKPFITADNRYL